MNIFIFFSLFGQRLQSVEFLVESISLHFTFTFIAFVVFQCIIGFLNFKPLFISSTKAMHRTYLGSAFSKIKLWCVWQHEKAHQKHKREENENARHYRVVGISTDCEYQQNANIARQNCQCAKPTSYTKMEINLNNQFLIVETFRQSGSYLSFEISDTNRTIVVCMPPPVHPAKHLANNK